MMKVLKNKSLKSLASVLLALVLVVSTISLFNIHALADYKQDVSSGVVPVCLYLTNAGYYVTDGYDFQKNLGGKRTAALAEYRFLRNSIHPGGAETDPGG